MNARRHLVSLLIPLLCLTGAAAPGSGPSADRLQVPGLCTIETPGKGWVWKAVNEYDPKKGGIYMCTMEGDPSKLVFIIDPRKLTTDEERIATLKAHFNALVDSLKQLGCADSKGKRPQLKPPIPDDVDYFVIGTTPQGRTVNLHAHTVFKEHTYLIQAAGPSLAEAEKLANISKTLKER